MKEHRDLKFCSKTCSGKNRKNPSKHKTFTCQWCNKQFEDWAYRNTKFCSRQCSNEYAAKQPKPSARKNVYITKPCAYCGRLHIFNKHQIRLRGGKYCSRQCLYSAMSIARRGAGNPNFNGGVTRQPYGPNWGSQSKKARKRDDYTCQSCGYRWHKKAERFVDVHHIVPNNTFGGDFEKSNALTNLIVLCRRCHRKIESGKMPCPTPKGL